LRASTVLPFVVLAVSLASTGVWYYILQSQGQDRARSDFESEARQTVSGMREEMLGFEEVIQAGAGLISASDSVSRQEWQRFVERLELPSAYPAIETVSYAERISIGEIPDLQRRMTAIGNTDFAIWPPGTHDEYVVNTLIEPSGGVSQRALGFDLTTEPTRLRAMEQSRDTASVVLSDRLTLVIDQTPQPRPGFLLFAPVYRHDVEAKTVEGRRTSLTGYVTAAFHLDEVVNDVLRDRTLPLGVSIWDANQKAAVTPVYANARGEETLAHPNTATLTTDIPFSLSGQNWTVRFSVGRPTTSALQGTRPLLALAAGVPLSLLLFGIAWSETNLRGRATKLAGQMTAAVRKQAQLLDLTHDTVILRDRENVIRYWNRAARDAYGFSADEAMGRTVDELLKTRYPAPLESVWEEVTRTGRWEGELIHTRRDGTEMIVASRWAVQRRADGQIESILETNNDITERRHAEEDRRRLEASLLQAQKLEAMGTLAGGVAHDFNNILGAVLGYGELAQNAAPAGSALRRYVDSMMSAGQRAKSLVERILAFSRSGVGPRTAVHVQSVATEALEILTASLPDHIHLATQLHADDAAVIGDPTQIHQVVLNLCTNAVHAMKVSGGTLGVKLDCVTLDAPTPMMTGTLAPGEYVRLVVSDTGAGIEPALHRRIFDPFFTTKGVGVGTGLGLSLVHGIVTDLGGGVDMTSEIARGTTFTIYMPRHGYVDPAIVEPERVAYGDGEAILVVDDEEMLVRLAEEMIAGLGYEAIGFTSPIEALQAFRSDPERFSAVLSDETMPGMTGSQLAEKIAAIRPDVAIILMSGYAGPTLAARAHAAGARDVLAKPLQAADIARALANALGKQPAQEKFSAL
jgi:PAS domain S-box-containing protein